MEVEVGKEEGEEGGGEIGEAGELGEDHRGEGCSEEEAAAPVGGFEEAEEGVEGGGEGGGEADVGGGEGGVGEDEGECGEDEDGEDGAFGAEDAAAPEECHPAGKPEEGEVAGAGEGEDGVVAVVAEEDEGSIVVHFLDAGGAFAEQVGAEGDHDAGERGVLVLVAVDAPGEEFEAATEVGGFVGGVVEDGVGGDDAEGGEGDEDEGEKGGFVGEKSQEALGRHGVGLAQDSTAVRWAILWA